MASAVAPEAEAARQDATEDRAEQDSVRLTLAVTISAEDFVARITAHSPQRWQVIVAPADRAAAQSLIDAAEALLAKQGRSDRFVVVEASRATGTLEVASQP